LSVYGNPEKLVREIAERVAQEAEREISEAHSSASKLLEDAYRELVLELERKISESYSRQREALRSIEAALESSLRSKVADVKAKWISMVLEEARSKLYAIRGATKENMLAKLINDFIEKVPEAVGFTIYVKKEDLKLVNGILESEEVRSKIDSKKLTLTVEEAPPEFEGGFKAVSTDGRIVYDYSFARIFEMIKPKLERTASTMLFER